MGALDTLRKWGDALASSGTATAFKGAGTAAKDRGAAIAASIPDGKGVVGGTLNVADKLGTKVGKNAQSIFESRVGTGLLIIGAALAVKKAFTFVRDKFRAKKEITAIVQQRQEVAAEMDALNTQLDAMHQEVGYGPRDGMDPNHWRNQAAAGRGQGASLTPSN